jgi:hypothetical protein
VAPRGRGEELAWAFGHANAMNVKHALRLGFVGRAVCLITQTGRGAGYLPSVDCNVVYAVGEASVPLVLLGETGASLDQVVSTLTLVFGILVKVIGFPEQFFKNRERRSTDGVSRSFYALAVLSYTLTSLQSWLAHDLVVCVNQGLGVITSGAIVTQIIIYRKGRISTIAAPSPQQPEQPGAAIQIRIGHRRRRTTVRLPADLDWPAHGATIVARRVPEGVLLTATNQTHPGSPAVEP